MARFLTQVVRGLGSGVVGALAMTATRETRLRSGHAKKSRAATPAPDTVALYLIGGLAIAVVAWLFIGVGQRRTAERAEQAAEEERHGVNQRNSGMIH